MEHIPPVEVATELPHSTTVVEGSDGIRINKHGKVKIPRVRLHCSDGIYEEYSTDEEDEEKIEQLPLVDPTTLTWIPYFWHYGKVAAISTLSACDFMGEKFAYFFGITSPKYEYIMEDAKRAKEDEEVESKAEREAEKEFVMETLSKQPASIVVENENVSPV